MARKNKKENKALKKLLMIIGSIVILSLLITFYLIKNANYMIPTHETKTDTEDWKNFTNEKYSFSFKYPSSLKVIFPAPSLNAGDKVDFDNTSSLYLEREKAPTLALTFNAMPTTGTTLSLQRETFLYPDSKNRENEIFIDSVKAYKFTNPDSEDTTVLVENNGTIFSISKGPGMSLAEFNSIINSLHFTK